MIIPWASICAPRSSCCFKGTRHMSRLSRQITFLRVRPSFAGSGVLFFWDGRKPRIDRQMCDIHIRPLLAHQVRNVGSSSNNGKEPPVMSEVQATIVKAVSGHRRKLDVTKDYTERNFVTPVRAMSDYLLKPSDLEGLRMVHRRSPYEDAPPITVYLRRDVEAKALEVWGSYDALQKEHERRRREEQKYRESMSNVKSILKEYQRAERASQEAKRREQILQGSGRVVHTAVVINGLNFAFKGAAWLYTGSHSMFAEAIHSLSDTCNQLLLAFGIHKSIQQANPDHPYGYHNMRYVSSLISGVGVFFFGAGLAWYHGIKGLMHPEELESLYWAFFILGGSLISEGGTFLVAFNELKKGARREKMTMLEYVKRSRDPSVNVVLLEDMAAVLGVTVAAACMGLATQLGDPTYDAIGSLIIGTLLGSVAAFIVYSNSVALVGRSIPFDAMQQINKELENDVMIRAIHDVKATDMGNYVVRYKAEIDIDGRELTKSYLDTQDMELLLEEVMNIETIEQLDAFMLKHGENIVDLLGAQVDRIESNLKKRHPEVRHVDLEVL
ncbi:solute carrier family 30 member 9 isoform X1 [Dermacentor variabilis]|uniref:solute carrier family 30 member 9 isoform X1 n=2 Tax=Dermacentor variabilis TaxID=34621 RepID=UPI003F5BA0DC